MKPSTDFYNIRSKPIQVPEERGTQEAGIYATSALEALGSFLRRTYRAHLLDEIVSEDGVVFIRDPASGREYYTFENE